MIKYLKTWMGLKTDRRGVTALEYGVIAALVIGVAAAGFTTLGTGLSTKVTNLANQISPAAAP
jgi:pilus assembly protein Flp/PilA